MIGFSDDKIKSLKTPCRELKTPMRHFEEFRKLKDEHIRRVQEVGK